MSTKLFAGKSWEEWIEQYAQSHQNPINQVCHTIGIPLIALSIVGFVVGVVVPGECLWWAGFSSLWGIGSRANHRNFSKIGGFCL